MRARWRRLLPPIRMRSPLCQTSDNTLASMLIVANLALLYHVRGQLHAAAEVCRQTIDAFGPSSTSPALATVYCCESEVLFEWGDQEARAADNCRSGWN